MTLLSNGNVGIGTTTPLQLLDVNGNIRSSSNLILNGVSPTIIFQDNDHYSGMIHMNANLMYFLNGAGVNSPTWVSKGGYWPLTINMSNDDLVFGGRALFLEGNVGIGTVTPAYILDVAGTINTSVNYALGGTAVVSGNANDVYGNFRVLQNNSSTASDGMYINYNSTGTTGADLRFYANGVNERMRIKASNGFVGIGIDNPTAPLEIIHPNLGINDASLRIRPLGGGNNNSKHSIIDMWSTFEGFADQAPRRTASIRAWNGGGGWGGQHLSFYVGRGGNPNDLAELPTERVRITTTGNNLTAGGSWGTLSDARVKSEVTTLTYGLSEILKLRPVNYNYHDPMGFDYIPARLSKEGKPDFGFLAQQLYKIIPEAVIKPADETLTLWAVTYEKLVPVLVKAIQEQQSQIELLKTENKDVKLVNNILDKKYNELKSALEKLESYIYSEAKK